MQITRNMSCDSCDSCGSYCSCGEEEEDDEEEEEEEEEEELTGEALAEMDFEELEDVCDDKDLDTDPDDFDEEDIEKLRKAIAKELGIKLPAKKEAKGKGKKGKK